MPSSSRKLALSLLVAGCHPVASTTTTDDDTVATTNSPTAASTTNDEPTTGSPDTTGTDGPTTDGPVTTDSPATTDAATTDAITTDAATTDEDSTSTGAPADCTIVEFADPDVEDQVRIALGSPVGPITGEQLATLTYLVMAKENTGPISDLGGLECAPALEVLGVADHTTLKTSGIAAIAGLTKLTNLDLSFTGVDDIAVVANFTALRGLNLHGAPVSDLSPIAGLVEIIHLNASMTAITDVDALAGLVALETLWMQEVQVSDLSPLQGLGELVELELSGSAVIDLGPLAALSELKFLTAANTAISDVSPLADLPLRSLDLADSEVVDISPLASLPTPGSLVLRGNHIVEVDALLGAGWTIADDECGGIDLRENPLSPAAKQDVLALCEASHLLVETDEGQCGGTPACIMP